MPPTILHSPPALSQHPFNLSYFLCPDAILHGMATNSQCFSYREQKYTQTRITLLYGHGDTTQSSEETQVKYYALWSWPANPPCPQQQKTYLSLLYAEGMDTDLEDGRE